MSRLIIYHCTACPKQIGSTTLKVIKVMFSRIYIWDIVFPFLQVCTEVAVMHLKYELFVVGLCALRTSGICPFSMFYTYI